jgi:hypothetical protein
LAARFRALDTAAPAHAFSVLDYLICVTSSAAAVLTATSLAYLIVRAKRRDTRITGYLAVAATFLAFIGSIGSAATCLPLWFGLSEEQLSKLLQAIGGLFTVAGAAVSLKALPGFTNFIRPVLRSVQWLGAVLFGVSLIALISILPRAATGYSDLAYAAGDKPVKTRACDRVLDFGLCRDMFTVRLDGDRRRAATTYRLHCIAHCGDTFPLKVVLEPGECSDAKVEYRIRTNGTLLAEGELNRIDNDVEFKTDDMAPGQEVELQLEAIGGQDCRATVTLTETSLD